MARHRQAAIWSEEALGDLAAIWNYYLSQAGSDTAEKITRQINEGAELLAEHPYGGRDRDEINAGLRSLSVTPHVLFYRMDGDQPEIVRVLDARQDIQSEFQ